MHGRNPHSAPHKICVMDSDLLAQQDTGTMHAVIGQDPMISGQQLSKPLLSLRAEMNAESRGEDKTATSDNELNDSLVVPVELNDSEDTPSKLFGARGSTTHSEPGTPDQHQPSQTHPSFTVGAQPLLTAQQPLLTAQQLASAVAGVMPTSNPALNQPILIPFNMAGQLGNQQGLVLTLPTANLTNIQSLVAAAAAGGIMTLPLQNLQATSSLNSQIQQLQHLQQLQHQQQQGQHQHQQNHQLPGQQATSPQKNSQSPGQGLHSPLTPTNPLQLASQAAAMGSMGSIAGSQAFSNALSNLQGMTSQLVTNAQGQIIGTIPLMSNPTVPSNQNAGGTQGIQVQPITPQLLTNAQGQIIATVIGNQILPVINTQGITLSPIKPGQQQQQQHPQVGQAVSQANLLHMAHGQSSLAQSPVRQASSSSSSSCSSSALSVGQLVSNPQTAASEVDGVNLEEIREFAKAFKIRRLSLGLTQTQVGQALSATEGPAYSQSAICRFEKLDITPKSAQKIKPVLERWMAEAEARHRAGMQNLTEFIGSEPSKKRKRRTSFTPQALEILNAHFEKNTHPSGQEMTEIAEKLNYDREVVRVWFCNKRQALKNTVKRLKPPEPSTGLAMEPLTDTFEEAS
ncbi:POU domain, class 6, transcription factor 2 isoform X2 [Leucoraja erinacea]|uniref:POU domain, class 6, transcription factor 2 isoform X2 n=1 Tax=Leucoraja erinaceus TaxID=7782 RepID=UPI002457A77A|nr:POU domain, class 6, transcription factor 2 isoform X2 [Leucoraja erinacea]